MKKTHLSQIMNPRTGKWVKTSGQLGKTILNNYLNILNNNMYGGAQLKGDNLQYINRILNLNSRHKHSELYIAVLLTGKNAISDESKRDTILHWGVKELKQAYLGLTLKLHSDRNPDNVSISEEAFKVLGTAHEWAQELLDKGKKIEPDVYQDMGNTESYKTQSRTGTDAWKKDARDKRAAKEAEKARAAAAAARVARNYKPVTVNKKLEDFFKLYKMSLKYCRWGFFKDQHLAVGFSRKYPKSVEKEIPKKKTPYSAASPLWGSLGEYEAFLEKERQVELDKEQAQLDKERAIEDQLHNQFIEKLDALKLVYFKDIDSYITELQQKKSKASKEYRDYMNFLHVTKPFKGLYIDDGKDARYTILKYNNEILTIGIDIALSVKRDKVNGRNPGHKWIKHEIPIEVWTRYNSSYASPYFWVNMITGEIIYYYREDNSVPVRRRDGGVALREKTIHDKVDKKDTDWRVMRFPRRPIFWLNTDIGGIEVDDPYYDYERFEAERMRAVNERARVDAEWQKKRVDILRREEEDRVRKYRKQARIRNSTNKFKKVTKGIIASNKWTQITDYSIENRIMQKILDNCEPHMQANIPNWKVCPVRYITSLTNRDLHHFLNDIKLNGNETKSKLVDLALDKVIRFMETI